MKTYLLLWCLFRGDVDALAADEFATREAAEAHLCQWSDLAYPLLQRDFTDREQRRRARRIVASAVPAHLPPLTLLSGHPIPEWWKLADEGWDGPHWRVQMGPCPGRGWMLAYLRHDARGMWAGVSRRYCERARSQTIWRDWDLLADSREATRLLVRDLIACGVPPVVVRAFCRWLEAKEVALCQPEIGRVP